MGPGRAIVEVNVDADMDSQTITERILDPNGRVAVSAETEDNKSNSTGSNPAVTVASNLPDKSQSNSGNSSSSSSQTRERQNFDVSETKRERVVQPGQVRRISVAVMVDGITTTASNGNPTWAPRPQTEMETLRLLVQSAIGFDASRGDTVTIESLQFTLPPEQGTLAQSGPGFLQMQGAQLAQIGVLGLIVLALILFVVRPMLSRKLEPALVALTGPVDITPDATAMRQLAGKDVLDLPPQSASKIDRLREVIASRSEDSAAVLRAWIESPEPQKEPAQS